jgi:hypothetical protein
MKAIAIPMTASALLAAATVFGATGAVAQQAGVYVDDDVGYIGGYVSPNAGYGTRVYGYARRADEPEPRYYEPLPPRSCGQFRYWNGDYCADARVTPPDID